MRAAALVRAKQAPDHRRPAVDLALHEAGQLGRTHRFGFDSVLLDMAFELRLLQCIDDLAVDALDNIGSNARRARERIPRRRHEIGVPQFAQRRHLRTVWEPLPRSGGERATVIADVMYLNSSACFSVTSSPFTSVSCKASFGKNSSRVCRANARDTFAISA